MHSSLRLLLGFAALALPHVHADIVRGDSDDTDGPGDIKIDAVVDMEPAGKKIAHPTPDKPAYYLPVVMGFEQKGAVVTFYQRQQPPKAEVERLLVNALADEGYRIFTKQFHPSLVLFISWGTLAPQRRNVNQAQMLHLVEGQNFDDDLTMKNAARSGSIATVYDPRKTLLLEEARRPRYYLLVRAIDYRDFSRYKKITPLWVAHISVPYWGHSIGQVLPALIKTGVPLFGRDTNGPQWIHGQAGAGSYVNIGDPVFKGYQVPAASDKNP